MRKKLVAILLLVIISSSVITATYATENTIFSLTDPESDLQYEIRNEGGYISVNLSGNEICKTLVKDVTAYSLYGSVLTMYTVDSLNLAVGVYDFDFYNNSIDSYVINSDAYQSSDCFTKTKNGNVYFASEYDRKFLCEYNGSTVKKINLKAQINQLLCINGESVIIVTSESTLLYKNGTAEKLLSYPLSFPARYTGNNTLKDISGTEYIFEDSVLKENVPATEINTHESIISPDITSSTFIAEKGATVAKINKAFRGFLITEVRKADGKIIDSGNVGTGTTVTFSTGEEITVIIYGDLTGEGNINSKDLKVILNHLSEKEELSFPFTLSADVNGDGSITTKDALKISQMY